MMTNTATYTHSASFSEDKLLEACLKQDRKAQKKLYSKYADAMYTLAFRITASHDLAADALQDAFIDVFRDLSKFKKQSSLGAWIKTIVLRKATKTIRFEKRFTEWTDDLNARILEPQFHRFDSMLIEKAIQQLPESCRAIFILVEVEGHKHTEVSEILNIHAGTSRSQLHHAKKLLRTYLRNER